MNMTRETTNRPPAIFNTLDAQGGTVNNINGDFINDAHFEQVIHVYINKPDGVPPQQFFAAYTIQSSGSQASTGDSAAILARVASALGASRPPVESSTAPSDRDALNYKMDHTRQNTIHELPLELRVIAGLMDGLVENTSVRHSPTLPETLASLQRIMKMTELALRIYQHTPLARTLGLYLKAEAEHCRRCLQNLLTNVSDWRHGLSGALLHAIRRYVWSGVGEGCVVSELNAQLREVHTSLASCVLALGRRVNPRVEEGSTDQKSPTELQNGRG
ncbi:hypothetical protein HWV62_3973 [Athelia sp. TMB]|nr:hypothetical protein HWV62_3973 [Athelia sp. TMB]